MVIKVPKFQNDEVLSEKELYALARLPIEFFRWQSFSQKTFGFFAPSESNLPSTRNKFHWENDSLSINNLFVISPQGYPFICLGQRKIESTRNSQNLYAVLHFPKNSVSYEDNGYRIEFEWDIPEIETPNQEEFLPIKLGKLIKDERTEEVTFEIVPQIIQLQGTSRLWTEASKLQENIEKYIKKLVTIGEKNIDISEYLDRLERLNIFSQKTEVNEFIAIVRLTLVSAQGFYYRLIDDEDKRYQYDEDHKNYRGRALENKLAENYGTLTEPEIFEPINELLQMEVHTGQQQQDFIEKLAYLFAPDKLLSQKLQTKRQRISQSEGYPQNFDLQRWLYRYELPRVTRENKTLVIEFNREPTNVAFIYTSDPALTTSRLSSLKQNSQTENTNNKRYELPPFNTESYLFIAAPEGMIAQVELVNK